MIQKLRTYMRLLHVKQNVTTALARAAATSALRQVDETDPVSWEFSGFSQNGEDGIIDFLTRKLRNPNYYFIEIGASAGIENNTAWLAIARKYNGLMVEGDPAISAWCATLMRHFNLGVDTASMFVSKKNLDQLLEKSLYPDPDVFSLDIDGNDYYIAQDLLEGGFRPKIFVVEYNSAFGPEEGLTIRYDEQFEMFKAHPSGFYYGASVRAFRHLLEQHGYRFVTVDRNGVNAFFIEPAAFDAAFVENLQGLEYAENYVQRKNSRKSWREQMAVIEHMPLVRLGQG